MQTSPQHHNRPGLMAGSQNKMPQDAYDDTLDVYFLADPALLNRDIQRALNGHELLQTFI